MKNLKTRVGILVAAAGRASALLSLMLLSMTPASGFNNRANSPLPGKRAAASTRPQKSHAALSARLAEICGRAGGEVAAAVIHVESGEAVDFEGAKMMPLYSVYKLPLAVAVLKDVEDGRLRLDQKVRVTPADIAAGAQMNSERWRSLTEPTVAQLLELSIVFSDNTSSEKLLELVGGAPSVNKRVRALGLRHIDINKPAPGQVTNKGAAADLARLLTLMQQGKVLRPQQLKELRALMEGAKSGLNRLRGNLPAGTVVADKTGTGANGSATNDVGIVTLPGGKGHLAIAVFISASKLTVAEQEKVIAEIARAAYDAYAS